MTIPWMVAFAVLASAVVLTLIVVLGVLRRAVAALEAPIAHQNIEDTSNQVVKLYGGLEPGARVGPFTALDSQGTVVSSELLLRKPHVFVFLAAGCPPCEQLVDDLAASPQLAREASIVLVTRDSADAVGGLPPEIPLLRQTDDSMTSAFQARTFPQAFAVDQRGIVRAVAIANDTLDLVELARFLRGGDREAIAAPLAVGT